MKGLERVLIVVIPLLLIAAALQQRWEWGWHGSGVLVWLFMVAAQFTEGR